MKQRQDAKRKEGLNPQEVEFSSLKVLKVEKTKLPYYIGKVVRFLTGGVQGVAIGTKYYKTSEEADAALKSGTFY